MAFLMHCEKILLKQPSDLDESDVWMDIDQGRIYVNIARNTVGLVCVRQFLPVNC